MKIYLNQFVKIEGDPFPHYCRKEFEGVVVPRKGDYIEDSLWKEPGEYEVTGITFNYQENYCYVNIEHYQYEIPIVKKDEFAHIAGLHGWKTSWKK